MFQGDTAFAFKRLVHGIRIHRLHADDFDIRAQLLDVSRHAGNQSAAADGSKDRMDGLRVLAQDFHRDGTLPGDHIGVIIGMHKNHPVLLLQFQRMLIGIGIGIAVQHHFRATAGNRLYLDLRRGRRHHDDRFAAELLRAECHALRVVPRRSRDHAALKLLRRELRHFVVCAAHFEGKHRLHILALEQ